MAGFRIVGDIESVEVFERRPEEEVVEGADKLWLARMARNARKNSIEQVKATPVDDILKSLWHTATNNEDGEVKMGWAEGPYSEQQISDLFQDDLWNAPRRFGVSQGFKKDDVGEALLDEKGQKIPKIRQIDDFSEYFVNACTTIRDKITCRWCRRDRELRQNVGGQDPTGED